MSNVALVLAKAGRTCRGLPISVTQSPPADAPALDLQPTLADAHVRLRPLAGADRVALRRAAADPLIWEQHIDPERHGPTFDRFFDANLASGGALVVEDAASGEVIGHTRYEPLPGVDDAVELGWTFLVLHIAADNTRSRMAAGRIGGRLLGPGEHAAWQSTKPNYTSYLLPERIG